MAGSVAVKRGDRGLSSEEAQRRLAQVGPNLPPRPRRRSLTRRVWDQVRDPMILLLTAAFVVVLWLGDVSDAIVISAVVTLNTIIGVGQELRAERAVAALDRLAAPHATVMRDGDLVRLPAAEVVPGDAVRLEAGDVVPADGRLDEAAALQVDESAMTGESVPVVRDIGQDLLSGTVVTRGRGLMTVQRTGATSGLGRIAALIASTPTRPTPLQQRLASLSRLLVVLTLGAAALVAALGVVRGEPVTQMLILGVSLAVAAIPESLPAVVSVALALGAHRMARRSAIVRWLPAVETLGSVNVLASDKTGTLTEGRMMVQRLWTPTGTAVVTGRGYGTAGEVGPLGDPAMLRRLLRDTVLCNDARLSGPVAGEWGIVGDPLEAAFLVAAAKDGIGAPDLYREWTRMDEEPFDSGRRRMTTLHRRGDTWLTVSKGAPETVLELLPDSPEVREALGAADRLAAEGFRVLAIADAERAAPPGPGELEHGLGLVGLGAVADPPREGAADVVDACRNAGIRIVLVTGDHPETARAVADQLGLGGDGAEIADGAMVARGEHVAQVDRIGVYARTRPEQKVDVLAALQARGDVVAMTGDGVNDAPALRRADIGVAMGCRGTEVARQAADLVLADDDLGTIVVAVAEGRRIYANIRTFLRYGLSGGFAEVLVLLLGPFLGLAAPLAAGQILWINLLTHGVPGVAFGGEPLDPERMRRPSPSPQRSTLGDGLWWQVLATGVGIAAVSVCSGLWAQRTGEQVQACVFLTLGLAQLGVALGLRAPRHGADLSSRALELAVLLAAGLQVLPLVWSPAGQLLGIGPVGPVAASVALALAALPGIALTVLRRWRVPNGFMWWRGIRTARRTG